MNIAIGKERERERGERERKWGFQRHRPPGLDFSLLLVVQARQRVCAWASYILILLATYYKAPPSVPLSLCLT